MEWRKTAGFPGYEVSEDGRVRNLSTGRISRGGKNSYGYVLFALRDLDGRRRHAKGHRLVATAFLGEIPAGMTVNHKDRNRTNNHRSNLEIVTSSENARHAWAAGAYHGHPHYSSSPKMTRERWLQVFAAAKEKTRAQLAAEFGLSLSYLGAVLTGARVPAALREKKSRRAGCKLSMTDISALAAEHKSGASLRGLGNKYGVQGSTVRRAITSWAKEST